MKIFSEPIVTRSELVVLAFAVAALFGLSFLHGQTRSTFSSVEMQFTDPSLSGLAIVPASCPSNAHTSNECDPVTFTTFTGTLPIRYSTTQPGDPSSTDTSQNGSGSGSGGGSGSGSGGAGGAFAASGHLEAVPKLVRSGTTVQLYWNTEFAASCSISGNGDEWNTLSSGTAGVESSPIQGRSVYTLVCTARPGVSPSVVEESVTVNVVPAFQEI